ncbi:retron-type RNA-directed DNA polymerase [uncultured phage cr30_1]|uniref:Retron-type RNA-directed DNA polymerase n=1 Tax=uncultured phage cr30_1 TaxID=2986411 RepID=A0AAE7V3S5_9CAUD|nr:Reverse transcriptase [uncultured phage cr30_1]QWM89126.1 retron-type RNA-directed DNA polymerase [uncultured phage cr30_1]
MLVVLANAPLITILMKRISNIFEGIINYNNILYADEKARKGKLHSYGVKHHDRNRERNLHKLQDALTNLTYKTSEYSLFTIHEPKERLIYRLPYFPDRIAHHTLMNYLEPTWEKIFIAHTYACRKNKGIHKAAQDIKKVLRKDVVNTQYCLKLDIKKFYHTHTLLRKSIKHRMCKCLSRLYNKTYSNSYARRKVCSYFGWLKFCNSINFCKKLVLRVCKKYNLTTPEIFAPKKDIISNVLDKKLKFIGYKIYNKYFKLYVITNKLISVTSKSRLLLSLMRDIISTYIIIIFHKRYNAYEILL